jgi:aminoglycoside 3-N-acetyltransferase
MIRQLDIKPGSLVMVTADVTRLALAGRRLEVGFSIDHFIDCIRQVLGKGGTLVIPAFNFNLKNNDHFIPSKTLPVTGALAVAAMKRPEFIRTRNPLHSFLAWGEHAEALAALDNRSSFSKDSPFAFMKEHQAKMLLIDTTISAAFTFVHHVEEMEQVGYRRFKRMNIHIEDEMETGRQGDKETRRQGDMETGRQGDGETGRQGDGETGRQGDKETRRWEVMLYAKKAGWTMDLSGLEKILIEKQVAKKMIINKIAFTLVDLPAAYPVIQDDIRQNKARNLAKFSFNLYLRETAKSTLAAFGIHTLADKISHDPGLL